MLINKVIIKRYQFLGVFTLNFYTYLLTDNNLHCSYSIDITNIVFPIAHFICTSHIKLLIVC